MAGAAQMSAYVSAGAAQMSADVLHTQPHMLLGTIQAITTARESTLPHFSTHAAAMSCSLASQLSV